MADRSRLALGVLDDVLVRSARLTNQLVLLHHPLGPDPGRLHQPIGLVGGALDDLVALLEEPPRFAQLLGQAVDRLLQDRAELLAVDRDRRRHRQLPGGLEHLPKLFEQGGGIRHLLGVVLEHRHTSCERKVSIRRSLTFLGTMPDTSPPKRATSRTRLDDRNECCGLVDRKNVSMPDRRWFICAICNSWSKSETARSPLMIAVTSCSRAKSTSRPLKNSMRMLEMCSVASFSIC